ncbi:MAG: hypothetical protein ABUS79_10740 [Pseudomonadota bacterium]
MPFTQTAGAVHCGLVVHVLLQVVVTESHRPGAQFVPPGVTHAPAPLHVAGGIRVEAVMHRAAAHWVPEAQRAH